jgi:hypothetical protein
MMADYSDELPEIFSSWEIAPTQEIDSVAYGLSVSGGDEPSIWRVNLPADTRAASADLEYRAASLQKSLRAMDTAPERAERLVRSVSFETGGELSFNADQEMSLAPPEEEALRLLTALEYGEEEVVFGAGAGDSAKAELERSEDRFRLAIERVMRLVSHLAWVETQVEGSWLGRTIVGWSGDMQTVWSEEAGEAVYWMHQRSLSQALQARVIQIHALVVTTRSAAKLAVLLTNPAGAILALPVAWKLVEQLLADIDKYQQITS